MDQERIIRSLRLQLLIERSIIGVVALVFLVCWGYGRATNTKSFIMVNGKPVACVSSETDAREILRQVKSKAGANLSEVEFEEDVVVARAPRDAEPVSRHKAFRTVERSLSPVVPRWAVIVNGKPVVALESRTMAGEVLDLARLKFGKLAKNLAEEPQFKEDVTVGTTAVSPSIFCKTPEEAIKRLFDKPEIVSKNEVYTVRRGDIASTIAARCGVKLDDLWTMNPGVNLHRLQIGDKIRIKTNAAAKPRLTVVVRDQSDRTEVIPAPVQRVSSARMYVGKTAEVSPGRAGLRKVKIATVCENGRPVGTEILSEEVLREPRPRTISVGIKPR